MFIIFAKNKDKNAMKKAITSALLLLCIVFSASAQTGTWSGKLDVQDVKINIVFHLDGEEPTMDVPDQAAQGIPIQVERSDMGKLTIKSPCSVPAMKVCGWASRSSGPSCRMARPSRSRLLLAQKN